MCFEILWTKKQILQNSFFRAVLLNNNILKQKVSMICCYTFLSVRMDSETISEKVVLFDKYRECK